MFDLMRHVLAPVLLACATLLPRNALAAEATAFIRVNVLPMDRERVLHRQTVIVRDGEIAAIGRDLKIPADAKVIDGHGTAWLVPGLADMHVHADTRAELAVMLVNGLTTTLNMGEASNAFVGRTRAAVGSGETAGPRVLAALAVDGPPRYAHLVVPTPEAARWAVGLAKANGYEFIKVYNGLSPEVFSALVSEAKSAGLAVVGHGIESLGLERQVTGGQIMIAHLEEFLYAFMKVPVGADPNAAPEEEEIGRAVEFVKRTGVAVTADLATYQTISNQWGRPAVVQGYLRDPEARFVSPNVRISWAGSGYQKRQGSLGPRAQFLGRFVKALADAQVMLIAGTDAPSIPGLALGSAIHRDLGALEVAGLSRFQALATATRGPGDFLRKVRPGDVPTGTIEAGRRADLLLVAGNPLDDLNVLRKPIGVTGGPWHDAAKLQELLASVERAYQAGTP